MEWIARAKKRGMGGVLLSLLDIFEPFAPLVGQSLFVVAPLLGFGGPRQQLEELGHLLDDPAGVAQLRSLLEDDHAG
ncbi:MAG: hypothetical protein SNJ54_10290 [Anaerolineae bacterium]